MKSGWRASIGFLSLALLAAVSPAWTWAAPGESEWEGAPMGFRIDEVMRNSYGVRVRFTTDLPPPYVVAVFRMEEYSLGRHFPVRHKIVRDTDAFIAVDLTGCTVFLQVGAVGSMMNAGFSRDLYPGEIAAWKKRCAEGQNFIVHKPYYTAEEWKHMTYGQPMQLVGDYTWAGFVPGPSSGLGVRARAVEPGGETATGTASVEGLDDSVGGGTRVVRFEDTGDWHFARAYSARTNRSDEVICPRGFKPLAARDGYVMRPDFFGDPVIVEAPTNAVDGVVYPEGL